MVFGLKRSSHNLHRKLKRLRPGQKIALAKSVDLSRVMNRVLQRWSPFSTPSNRNVPAHDTRLSLIITFKMYKSSFLSKNRSHRFCASSHVTLPRFKEFPPPTPSSSHQKNSLRVWSDRHIGSPTKRPARWHGPRASEFRDTLEVVLKNNLSSGL